jgi:hypothetical protein
MSDLIPMSDYKFVSNDALNQLELIAKEVKNEISSISQTKQDEFMVLRQQEKQI